MPLVVQDHLTIAMGIIPQIHFMDMAEEVEDITITSDMETTTEPQEHKELL
jgi:hypothetical protein